MSRTGRRRPQPLAGGWSGPRSGQSCGPTALREANAKLPAAAGLLDPTLLSGEEALPTAEGIEAATRQLGAGQRSR